MKKKLKRNKRGPTTLLEAHLYKNKRQLVIGVDEAGRGSLAGPVSIAAAAFPGSLFTEKLPVELTEVRDSKQLSPLQRERCYAAVLEWTLFAEVVYISNRLIDQFNIDYAIELGISCLVRRLQNCGFCGLYLLIDGNYRLPLLKHRFPFLSYESIVKGDDIVFSIAAASIVAKVRRDRRMQAMSSLFPGYDLEQNKGYPTLYHREQIQRLGISSLHRRSYCHLE